MDTTKQLVDARRFVVLAAGMAALWTVLAIARTGVTYDLAPLIVAAVPAAAAGFEKRAARADLARLAVGGGTLALGVTLLLSAVGRLTGPSLLPFGGAAAEAVIFSVVGAAGGWLAGGGLRRS